VTWTFPSARQPAGRKPIDTRTVALDRLDEVIAAVGRAIRHGRRVYWVCPLVEESENSISRPQRSATPSWWAVRQRRRSGARRQRGADKDAAMARFAAGETQI